MSEPSDREPLPEAVEEQLYEIYFDVPAERREKLLAELCSTHAAHAETLRDRARTLARGDQLFRRIRAQLEGPVPSEQVGSYVVQSVLGQGGFGTVYLAEQLEPVQRPVALKVLQSGHVDTRALRRFEDERRVLARLRHACIAQIYDAGETQAGLPYFAMELVDGEPVTTFCDRRGLDVPSRLRLFLRICAAIQHAHQSGVVHRDIKPSNVLVLEQDGRPLPKVIDFGVAALAAPDEPGESRRDVESAQVGTPGYMSPEQALGGPIDTRTDVYALGVLLCELLCGGLPFPRESLRDASLETVAHVLSHGSPVPPSEIVRGDPEAAAAVARRRRVSVPQLVRVLRTDLDWVVSKAIARDSDARYASAAALAEDVERFLRREPVAARGPATSYLVRKFVARHRIAVLVVAFAILALLGGIGGLTWALGAVDHARQEAVAGGREAGRQRDVATAMAYAANITAAQLALGSGDSRTALQYLEASDPMRRGWEWRHLAAQCDHATGTIELEREISDLAWIDEDRFLGFEQEGEIGIWSARRGVREGVLPGWSGIYRAHALDRERGRVFVGNNQSVESWDLRMKRHLRRVYEVEDDVRAMALSPDGRTLAVSVRGGRVALVGIGGDFAVRTWPALEFDASALAFVDDDELLVALDDGRIQRRAPSDGALRGAFLGHTDSVDDLCLDRTRGLLYSASIDTSVRVWDLESARLRVALAGGVRMRRLQLSTDGSILYGSGGWTAERIQAWDTETFQVVGRYHGHLEGVNGLALGPGDRRLLSSGRDGTLRIWSASPPQPRRCLAAGRDARDLAVDAERRHFAVASMDGRVSVWNAETLQPVLQLETGAWGAGCALGVDRVYVAGSSLFGYALEDGARCLESSTQGHYVERLVIDPAERWLVGGHDRRLLVWSLPDGALRHVLELPVGTGRLVFDPRREAFLLGCADSTLRWLDPTTGAILDELRLDDGDRFFGGLSLHGDRLVAGLHGATLLWRRGTGPIRSIRASAIGTDISPDGSRIAAAGSDHAVRLFDADGMSQLLLLGELVYGTLDAYFVAGGRRLIALSQRWGSPSYIYVWSAPE